MAGIKNIMQTLKIGMIQEKSVRNLLTPVKIVVSIILSKINLVWKLMVLPMVLFCPNCHQSQDNQLIINLKSTFYNDCQIDSLSAKLEIEGDSVYDCQANVNSDEIICYVPARDESIIILTYFIKDYDQSGDLPLVIIKKKVNLSSEIPEGGVFEIDFGDQIHLQEIYPDDDGDKVPNFWEECQGYKSRNATSAPKEICDGHDNTGDGQTDLVGGQKVCQ